MEYNHTSSPKTVNTIHPFIHTVVWWYSGMVWTDFWAVRCHFMVSVVDYLYWNFHVSIHPHWVNTDSICTVHQYICEINKSYYVFTLALWQSWMWSNLMTLPLSTQCHMIMVNDCYFFLKVFSVMVKYNYSAWYADSACIEQGLV